MNIQSWNYIFIAILLNAFVARIIIIFINAGKIDKVHKLEKEINRLKYLKGEAYKYHYKK